MFGTTTKVLRRRPAPTKRLSTGATPDARKRFGALVTCDEMRSLCEPRLTRAVRDVAFDIACIAVAITVAILTHSILVAVLAAIYIGFMQRRLSNLLHELSHAKLFPRPTTNYRVGYVIAWLMMLSFGNYHQEHTEHHAFLGSDRDPKLMSYRARRATTPRRDKLDFIVRVVLANAVWDLPKAAVVTWLRQPGSRNERIGRAITWTVLVTVSSVFGGLGWLLILWVTPLILVRPLVNMVTDQINHLGLIQDGDVLLQTRGFTANPIVLHLLAGHHDDAWHPMHHLMSRIQHHQLADAFALIQRERPDLAAQIPWVSGVVFRRRSTPETPSALDQIVDRVKRRDATALAA